MMNNLAPVISDAILKDFSVGNDLVFLSDFEHSFNDLFKNKVYTQREIEYCEQFAEPMLRYASTWAAKEAVYKAIKQIHTEALAFNKIEILRDKPAGIPTVNLPENLSHLSISLSISHDGDYVWAIAIIKP